jgi:hypothetical protein
LLAAVGERLEENRRRMRQRRGGPHYLLQGLVVCGCCGYAVVGKGKAAPHPRQYYGCLGTRGHRFGGHPVCRNRSQRVEDVDAAVWQDVCALLRETEWGGGIAINPVETSTGIAPELVAEFREALDDLAKGVRRPEKMETACKRMDALREENRLLYGEQDIAVKLIRQAR